MYQVMSAFSDSFIIARNGIVFQGFFFFFGGIYQNGVLKDISDQAMITNVQEALTSFDSHKCFHYYEEKYMQF